MLYKILRKKQIQKFSYLLTIVSFFVLLGQNCSAFINSRIQTRENGYENIVIGIEEQVEEDIKLLDNLKNEFTQASNFLYSITKKRVFFKDIIILIPNSWTTEVYYDDSIVKSSNSRIKNSTWESYENSDILIENWDYSTNEIPFVVNYASKCGETGDNIIFPSKFFLDMDRSNSLFGSVTNFIVNLWSQFRYGIHPEYPFQNGKINNEFYLNENGEIEPTRCNADIKGKIKDKNSDSDCKEFLPSGLPSSECIFEEETNSRSLMLIPPSLIKMNEFCDNETDEFIHNRIAPTLHNNLCNGQSIWEVLRNHPDFRNFNNMPKSHILTTEPKFHVVKSRIKQTVLLIDKSIHYMHELDLKNLKNALIDYARLMINDEMVIGVVHFERTARVISRMMPAKDLKNKVDFYDAIVPKNESGSNSNLWNGISLSLSLLEINQNNQILPSGGRIVLITNSLSDPYHPNINNIFNETKKNGIIVDVIKYGSNKDEKLENLAKMTNGLIFKIHQDLVDIWSSLNAVSNRDKTNMNKNIEIASMIFDFGEKKSSIHFFIDSSISKKNSVLKIIFIFRGIKEKVDLSVFEPRGAQYDTGLTLKCNRTNIEDLKDQEDLFCEFFKPKHGKWIIKINSPWDDSYKLKISAMVFFGINKKYQRKKIGYYYFDDKYKRNTLSDIKGIVEAKARWAESVLDDKYTQSIYMALSIGNKPIVNAKVVATIYRPTGDFVKIQLYDNGLNSDRFKDDGIYSKYFTEFNSNGIYFGKVEVLTEKGSQICHYKTIGTSVYVANINSDYSKNNSQKEFCSPVQNIHRVIHLESFEMKNYEKDLDLIPPSKIKDLQVLNIDFRNEFVQLGFTAPGNDYEIGRCLKYEIRISKNASYFLSNENLIEGLPVKIIASSFRDIPNLSGHFENFYLSFRNIEAKIISAQIRALDEHHNYGEWSNFVNIKLSNEIKYSSRIKAVPKSIQTKKIDSLQDIKETQNFYSSIIIIISAFLLLIFMVQIILIILLLVQKFKKKKCFHDYKPIRV